MLRQRVRDLTAAKRTLDERLQATRSNNRFLHKRIAGLEARLAAPGPASAHIDNDHSRYPAPAIPTVA